MRGYICDTYVNPLQMVVDLNPEHRDKNKHEQSHQSGLVQVLIKNVTEVGGVAGEQGPVALGACHASITARLQGRPRGRMHNEVTVLKWTQGSETEATVQTDWGAFENRKLM